MRLNNEEWRYYDDELNIPYPWYTKGALEYLCKAQLAGKLIFEYGVGDSTSWFLTKGAICIGVDSNEKWAIRQNAYFKTDPIDFLYAISNYQIYDIIVIDGDFRDGCLRACFPSLRPGGFVIIDNFEQESVQKDWPLTRAFIKAKQLKIDIYKEQDHPDWQTAIVYR